MGMPEIVGGWGEEEGFFNFVFIFKINYFILL